MEYNEEAMVEYANEAVDAVKYYFDEVGINLVRVVDEFTYPRKAIVIHGDLMFNPGKSNLLKINVVRGTFISKISATRFRGQFYVLFPNGDISDIGAGRVIWNKTVQKYSFDATQAWANPQYIGDVPGYRLTKKLRLELPLSEVRSRLVKRIISHPEELEMPSREFYQTFFVGYKGEEVEV